MECAGARTLSLIYHIQSCWKGPRPTITVPCLPLQELLAGDPGCTVGPCTPPESASCLALRELLAGAPEGTLTEHMPQQVTKTVPCLLLQELLAEDPEGEFTPAPGPSPAQYPRVIDVGIPGPAANVPLWRRSWRDKILPALARFK